MRDRHYNLVSSVTKMAALFFNVWPFTTILVKVGLINYQKNQDFAKVAKILQKLVTLVFK